VAPVKTILAGTLAGLGSSRVRRHPAPSSARLEAGNELNEAGARGGPARHW
jgi:hypothetical protein